MKSLLSQNWEPWRLNSRLCSYEEYKLSKKLYELSVKLPWADALKSGNYCFSLFFLSRSKDFCSEVKSKTSKKLFSTPYVQVLSGSLRAYSKLIGGKAKFNIDNSEAIKRVSPGLPVTKMKLRHLFYILVGILKGYSLLKKYLAEKQQVPSKVWR